MNAQLEIVTRRAPVAPTSWNAETRTFDVVFSTGAGVERYDARGVYTEELSLSQEWPARVPFLDTHNRGSLDGVLGFADRLRTVGGEAHATVQLSRHNSVATRLAAEIEDGNSFGVSTGYIIHETRETMDAKTGRRTKVATRWTPVEISVVPVPADPSATIRSDNVTLRTDPAAAPVTPPAAAPVTPPAVTPAVAPPIIDRAAVNAEIRSIALIANLDQRWTDEQIDAGATVEQARAVAFDAMRQRAAPANGIRSARAEIITDHTDPEFRARTIGEAMYTRVTPAHTPSAAAQPYVGMTLLDVARDCLRVRSIATTGLAPASVIERALQGTSDFALILGDTIGRTLREMYAAAPSGLKLVGRQTTARDFKEKHRLQLSEAPRLEKVNEHGEFKSGTLVEGKESYRVLTYGRVIGFTRQAIVNDDLGAFADLSRRLGQASAATEAQLLVDLILSNSGNGPNMNDGKALFHTDHANKATGGDVQVWVGTNPPSFVDCVSPARLAMRKQAGLSGELIAVTPRFLLVPADLETSAEQGLAAITPTKGTDFNPFAGKLELVVEPRFTSSTRWYLAANPSEIDGLEYAYLEGNAGPQIETKAGFEVDGVQIRVRLDFGAGFVDYRSWHMNPGA